MRPYNGYQTLQPADLLRGLHAKAQAADHLGRIARIMLRRLTLHLIESGAMTITEAARIIGISRARIYQWQDAAENGGDLERRTLAAEDER